MKRFATKREPVPEGTARLYVLKKRVFKSEVDTGNWRSMNKIETRRPLLVMRDYSASCVCHLDLRNAPTTFPRTGDIVLPRCKRQLALVYLDDVIIYRRNIADHLYHLGTVLTLLEAAGVSLKSEKCKFFELSVDYLCHVIGPEKFEVATKNVVPPENAFPQASNRVAFLVKCL